MSILTVRQRGEWLVAGFNVGRLTETSTLQKAAGELVAALEDLPLRGCAAISFEGVEQASSQLSPILRAARAVVVDDRFGRLVLCRVGPSIGELLRLTRLDAAFEQFPRLRDVLAEPATASHRTYAGAGAGTSTRGRSAPSYSTQVTGEGVDTVWLD